MKKALALPTITALLLLGACNGKPSLTRVPTPPFQGDLPEDAYVYRGQPGLYGGSLVLSQSTDMDTFNPITASGTSSIYILHVHVYRCPVDYRNADKQYDPGLCTRWEMSPDGKQWTFHLRRGVRWSDGEPFSADDVLFTYDLLRDPQVDTSLGAAFTEGKDAAGNPIYPKAEKLDDYTVQFNLHNPNVEFLDAMYNLWLVPKHKWENAWRQGKFNEVMTTGSDPKDVVSLGPYVIKEHVSGQRVVLERNPYFWKVDEKGQRLPYLDRIVFVIVPNFDAILAKFQAGEIDAMWRVRAGDFQTVKKLEGPDIVVHDTGVSCDQGLIALNLNNTSNPRSGRPYVAPWKQKIFRNQKFRQAISYAINREGLIDTIFFGRGVPLYSATAPCETQWYSDTAIKYPHDPEKARSLLDEIGLHDTNGDGVREDAEGHRVEIKVTAYSGNDQRLKIASFLGDNLKDVGISVVVDPVPFTVLLERTETTFDFDVVVAAWQSGTPPSPINTKNIILSSAAQHISFPKQKSPSTEWEAELDNLVHKLDASVDQAERKRIYGEINRIWSEQLPEINLLAEKHAVTYKSKFGNIRPSSLFAHLTWNCEEIFIKAQ